MTILHNNMSSQSLGDNLAIYIAHLSHYDQHINTDKKMKNMEIFFRKFFLYFVDLDPVHFEELMRHIGEDVYRFFYLIGASPSQYNVNITAHYQEIEPECDNIVVFFTKTFELYQHIFPSVVSLIKKLNHSQCWNNLDHFHYSSQRGFSWKVFFEKLLMEFSSFNNRMFKISFQSWEEVYNAFEEAFPCLHFLEVMAMTEEYFNKRAILEARAQASQSEEEEEI